MYNIRAINIYGRRALCVRLKNLLLLFSYFFFSFFFASSLTLFARIDYSFKTISMCIAWHEHKQRIHTQYTHTNTNDCVSIILLHFHSLLSHFSQCEISYWEYMYSFVKEIVCAM